MRKSCLIFLGVRSLLYPMKYLGTSFGKSEAIWDGVAKRIEKRLVSWKTSYLSQGDCLTLIKSTLSSLLMYLLSFFLLPTGIARRLEHLQRDVLWDGMGCEPKFHLVNGKSIFSSIPRGGLGIKNLMLFNKALLGKQLWRYVQVKTPL